MTRQYGQPVIVTSLSGADSIVPLTKVPLTATQLQGTRSYDEKWLQSLIAAHPEVLPFSELGEPAFAGATSICTELPMAGKFADNLLITNQGNIILVECKLWRNPEARRSVVGQILEYATEMSRWDYSTLELAARSAIPAPEFRRDDSLYANVANSEILTESEFIDAVSRNLKRGRFLLLVIGDGIHEGIEGIASYLQSSLGLHFTLGLAELTVWELPDGNYLVQPRVLARTMMVERGVVILRDERMEMSSPSPEKAKSGRGPAPETITEAQMYEQLDAKATGLGEDLRSFLEAGELIGLSSQTTATTIKLVGLAEDAIWPLGTIDPKNGTIWFDMMASKAKSAGRHECALELYSTLVSLLSDPTLRMEKMSPGTKNGVRSLPLRDLLNHKQPWLDAISKYLKKMSAGPAR